MSLLKVPVFLIRLSEFRIRRLTQLFTEEISEVVILDLERIEDRVHLLVKLVFGEANSGMVAFMVLRTSVVDVLTNPTFGLLEFSLARDRRATVGAFDQVTGVSHLVRLVDLLTKERLDPIPELPVDERFVRAGMPLVSKLDFTNVGSVSQDSVQLAPSNLPESQALISLAYFP